MENPVNTAISGKKRRSPCGFLANTKTKKSMTMILFNIEITMNGVKWEINKNGLPNLHNKSSYASQLRKWAENRANLSLWDTNYNAYSLISSLFFSF